MERAQWWRAPFFYPHAMNKFAIHVCLPVEAHYFIAIAKDNQDSCKKNSKSRKPRMTTIEICLGSSCFARGNNRNLAVIQDYLKKNGLEDRVKLRGDLCHGNCKEGPNMVVDGERYTQVDPNTCIDILNKHFNKQ